LLNTSTHNVINKHLHLQHITTKKKKKKKKNKEEEEEEEEKEEREAKEKKKCSTGQESLHIRDNLIANTISTYFACTNFSRAPLHISRSRRIFPFIHEQ